MLNLKVNPVSREFVIHEHEWRSILSAAMEMEIKGGRPARMVEEDSKKNPMKVRNGEERGEERCCLNNTPLSGSLLLVADTGPS